MVLVEVVRYEEVDDGLKLTTNAKKILVVTTAIVIGGIVILALFLSTNVLSSKSNNSASSSTRLSSYSTTNASHYNKYLSVSSNVQVYIPPQLCAVSEPSLISLRLPHFCIYYSLKIVLRN